MPSRLLSISASSSREFQLIATALRQYVDRDLAAGIRKAARTTVEPIWRQAIGEASSLAQSYVPPRVVGRVFTRTAKVAVSDRNLTLKAAATGKPLSGGFDYRDREWAVFEFGVKDRQAVTTYTATSSKGKKYTVHKRHVRRQLPVRRAKGWVFYPAAADAIPRIAALYAQTAMRLLHEAVEQTGQRRG